MKQLPPLPTNLPQERKRDTATTRDKRSGCIDYSDKAKKVIRDEQ